MGTAIAKVDIERAIASSQGVLRPEPTWNANTWTPAGRRMHLPADQVDRGEQGQVVERWLASTTLVDSPTAAPGAGLSHVVAATGDRFLLHDAVRLAPQAVMGAAYAATHSHLGRLCKILDYGVRIPMHIHPPQAHADLVQASSKDEAYYFPAGTDMGPHPETFLGVHPWITGTGAQDLIHDQLVAWDSDDILAYSRAYKQMPEEGFYIPSGVLHAPGSALTIELQESADTISVFQALSAGRILDKRGLLFKNITPDDVATLGERAPMRWVDWELNADPDLYAKLHLNPVTFREEPGVNEAWIFHGNPSKFSGKRLRLAAGASTTVTEKGVYNVLALTGTGTVAGHRVTGGAPGEDEIFLTHDAATQPHTVTNTGTTDLTLIKFFGPDINPEAPPAGI